MPRKSKTRTLSGQEAGPARPAVGVPYGEGERRLEAQRRTPVPVAKGQNLPTAPVGGGGGAPQAAPADAQSMALAAVQAMAPPGPSLMEMPTRRPNEPLMAGAGQANPVLFDDGLQELRELVRNYQYPDTQDMLSVLQALARTEMGA